MQTILSMRKFRTVQPIDVDRSFSCDDDDVSDFPTGSFLILDQKSLTNLDIISVKSGQPCLFTILDKTCTAMGKRLLRTWYERFLLFNMSAWALEVHTVIQSVPGHKLFCAKVKFTPWVHWRRGHKNHTRQDLRFEALMKTEKRGLIKLTMK